MPPTPPDANTGDAARVRSCPLCDGARLADDSPSFVRCDDCGTLTRAIPVDCVPFEESAARYAHPVHPPELRWLDLLEAQLGALPRLLLDLGAGDGGFVGAACERSWGATGLEGSVEMVEIARAAGRPVSLCDLDEWEFDGTPVSAVRLWFVLEHVRRPGQLVRQLARALRPGGLLLLAVPNDANWLSRRVMRDEADRFWEHPVHLHHFPPFGLERFLGTLGLEPVIAESGRPTELMRGGALPLYETWERIRAVDPGLSRLFYELGVGRTREMLFRKK